MAKLTGQRRKEIRAWLDQAEQDLENKVNYARREGDLDRMEVLEKVIPEADLKVLFRYLDFGEVYANSFVVRAFLNKRRQQWGRPTLTIHPIFFEASARLVEATTEEEVDGVFALVHKAEGMVEDFKQAQAYQELLNDLVGDLVKQFPKLADLDAEEADAEEEAKAV